MLGAVQGANLLKKMASKNNKNLNLRREKIIEENIKEILVLGTVEMKLAAVFLTLQAT